MKRLVLIVAAATFVAGYSSAGSSTGKNRTATAATTTAELGKWGIDLSARDESIKPGDDFNRYANAKWLDSFEIPADLSSYGSFTKLQLEAEADIRTIVEELASAEPQEGALEQKVGDFYNAWMDMDQINKLGTAPLEPHLKKISAIKDKKGLMEAFAGLDNTAPFSIGIIPDPADTTRYIAFVSQSGLGMPNRDYYLKDDESFVDYRKGYRQYIIKVLTLAGIANPAAKADAIIGLETKLAEVHWTPEDSRDIQKIYNPMSPDKVAELAPQFEWQRIFNQLGLRNIDTFVVAQTTAIADAGKLMDECLEVLLKAWSGEPFEYRGDIEDRASSDREQRREKGE